MLDTKSNREMQFKHQLDFKLVGLYFSRRLFAYKFHERIWKL